MKVIIGAERNKRCCTVPTASRRISGGAQWSGVGWGGPGRTDRAQPSNFRFVENAYFRDQGARLHAGHCCCFLTHFAKFAFVPWATPHLLTGCTTCKTPQKVLEPPTSLLTRTLLQQAFEDLMSCVRVKRAHVPSHTFVECHKYLHLPIHLWRK